MDSSGRIHDLNWGPDDDIKLRLGKQPSAKDFQKLADEIASRIQAEAPGPLVRIPQRELPNVRAMSMEDRRAWYKAKLERKALRKRQRAARKRQR